MKPMHALFRVSGCLFATGLLCWSGFLGIALRGSPEREVWDSPRYPPELVRWSNPMMILDDPATTETKVLEGMPTYIWLHGCAPTAAAMFLAYYDHHHFPYLFPGDASVIPITEDKTHYVDPRTEATIASPAHYANYSLPMDYGGWILADRSTLGGAHEDNCIADYIKTSWSSLGLAYGSTWPDELISGVKTFVRDRHPEVEVTSSGLLPVDRLNLEERYTLIQEEIDAGRPVIASVDTDGDGRIDHAIPVIGYLRSGSQRLLVCHDGWFHNPRTIEFREIGWYVSFGVKDIITFRMEAVRDRCEVLHRFMRLGSGSYFFTASEIEKNLLELHHPEYRYEGVVHPVEGPASGYDSLVPVYRFRGLHGRGHFYTANESERDAVISQLSKAYALDGVAFHVHGSPGEGLVPVYRCLHVPTGSHYFSATPEEIERITEDVTTGMVYEGIAWWTSVE